MTTTQDPLVPGFVDVSGTPRPEWVNPLLERAIRYAALDSPDGSFTIAQVLAHLIKDRGMRRMVTMDGTNRQRQFILWRLHRVVGEYLHDDRQLDRTRTYASIPTGKRQWRWKYLGRITYSEMKLIQPHLRNFANGVANAAEWADEVMVQMEMAFEVDPAVVYDDVRETVNEILAKRHAG